MSDPIVDPLRVPERVPPRGYEDAMIIAPGKRILVLGGHVAFDGQRRLLHAGDLVAQFRVTLLNLRATLTAAGGTVSNLASLTVMTTDVPAYRQHLPELGRIWMDVFGKRWPAMTLLGVTELMEAGAVVEIDGLAAID